MTKRATLPDANDLLIGRKATSGQQPAPTVPQEKRPMVSKKKEPKVLKKEETTVPKSESTEVEIPLTTKVPKTQISAHLTEETLIRLEEVKYRLRAEHNVKATKSDIVEVALAQGLADPDRLAQALRNWAQR